MELALLVQADKRPAKKFGSGGSVRYQYGSVAQLVRARIISPLRYTRVSNFLLLRWEHEVVGSSPTTATDFLKTIIGGDSVGKDSCA